IPDIHRNASALRRMLCTIGSTASWTLSADSLWPARTSSILCCAKAAARSLSLRALGDASANFLELASVGVRAGKEPCEPHLRTPTRKVERGWERKKGSK